MPRITVNVSEDVEAWLESEADRLNWSKADAGGHCIDVLYSNVNHIDVQQLDVNTDDQNSELTDRVDDLESRLADLEQRLDDRNTTVDREPSPAPRERAADEPSGSHDESDSDDERGAEPVESEGETDEVIERIVADVSASWDEDNRLADRRDAARAALRLMRDRGSLGRTDAVEELLPAYGVEGQNERTWWRQNIRDAVSEAGSYSRGRSAYVWELAEGDTEVTDKDTSGVYDPTTEFE